MNVEVPAEVGLDGLLYDINDIGSTHGYMVLEAILADILHQLLQVVHLCDGDTPVHAVGVVGELALAQISLNATFGVVGGDAEEGEGAFADFCVDGAKGVNLAQCATQHAEGTQLQVVVADK